MGEIGQSQEIISPGKFISELWGIAPKEWWCEFFAIQYRPTQSDPDAKAIQVIFYTVDQVLKDWPTIEKNLQRLNRTEVRNIHQCVNPRFRRPKGGRGTNKDVEAYTALWIDVDPYHSLGNETTVLKNF